MTHATAGRFGSIGRALAFTSMIGLLGAGARAQSLCSAAVPCNDPRGCPDLVVDQPVLTQTLFIATQSFERGDCAVVEGEVRSGTRRLLKFASNTPNLGPGDLIIGTPSEHPEWFSFQNCHSHPHFRQYGDYRLWTPAAYQQWKELQAANPDLCAQDLFDRRRDLRPLAGQKQGFCVIDIEPSGVPCNVPMGSGPQFQSCGGNQGISVCWADVYGVGLSGQWIDITDVAPGEYVLEVEVNAERFFQETNYLNNASTTPVMVP